MIRNRYILIVSLPLLGASLAAAQGAADPEDSESIRTLRMASNEAIAAHDIAAFVSFLDDEYQITTSVGSMSQGIDVQFSSLQSLFEDRPDVIYIRTPDSIEISSSNPLASESGTWTGRWTGASGPVSTGGDYAAMWRKVDGVWKIRSELFVALYCDGKDCP